MVTLKRKNLLPPGSKFFPLRVAPNEEGDGLRLSHEKVYPFPSWKELNFLKTVIAIYFQILWLSKSFLNFPVHPQNSLTFPWPGKNFIFQTFFPDHGNPADRFNWTDLVFYSQCTGSTAILIELFLCSWNVKVFDITNNAQHEKTNWCVYCTHS